MMITMTNTKNLCLSAINDFLSKPLPMEFKSISRADRNEWIQKVIMEHKYLKCSRPDKGMLRKYIMRMTGISKSQLTRLIEEYKRRGTLKPKEYERHKFERVYTKGDIELLADLDNAHECLAGPATINIIKSDYDNFGKVEYERLINISVAHLYRLRITDRYKFRAKTFTKTNPVKRNIGERRKPEPNGKPGYLCVDTVHQGDKDGEKGAYHINLVDMTTQYEFVGSVEAISERYMKKILKELLQKFPFKIIEFHVDNGSEYINRIVAELLNKLLIKLTKSRPRRSNDNALVESKNGGVIRKHMGYLHIPRGKADLVDGFYQNHFNDYLNYHRPCAFAEIKIDNRGKEQKIYPKENYMTPYEKLKSLENAEQYLKPGISFAELDKMAYAMSHTDYAKKMQKAKQILFKNLWSR
jgi:transposase